MTKVGVPVEVARQVGEVVAPGEAVMVQQLQEHLPGVIVRNVPCCPINSQNERMKCWNSARLKGTKSKKN